MRNNVVIRFVVPDVNNHSNSYFTFDTMEMIVKPEGVKANDFEIAVANEIAEIAKKTKDLAEPLKTFKMTAAKEVEIEGDKKAIIVFVPYKLFKAFRMIQSRLTTELEKKFEGRPVVFIAQRTILGKSYRRAHKFNGVRPHAYTLTAVHEAIIDDLVYPCECVGKHTHISCTDGNYIKVFLGNQGQQDVENKLGALSTIYKKLTSKTIKFEFKN